MTPDSSANGFKCTRCAFKGGAEESPTSSSSTTIPYRPLMKQQQQPPLKSFLPAVDQFTKFQASQQRLPGGMTNDFLSDIPVFVPRDPHLFYSTFSSPPSKLDSFDVNGTKNSSAFDRKGHVASRPDTGLVTEESFILEKNLNAMRNDLKARVSDTFEQIMRALSAHQETINNSVDEKFADIGERLSDPDKETTSSSFSEIKAEVFKVTEEVNAKLAEAKLMIDVINSLESKKTLSAFLNYMSTS